MDKQEIRKQREQKVYKDNELISNSRFDLTVNEQKLILYTISKIKPTDKELQWIEISVDDFCKVIGIETKWFYNEFKDLIYNLDDKKIWGVYNHHHGIFRWFSEVWYIDNQAKVKVLLNSVLKDYLLNLKRNFTAYELINILVLHSKYSIKLYELLVSNKYKENYYISLNDLKEYLNCNTEYYKEFKYFNREILKKSIEEINKKTNINVEYDTIRSGRRITDIKFAIITKEDYEINGLRLVGNNMLDKGIKKDDYKRFVEYKQEIRNNRKEEM